MNRGTPALTMAAVALAGCNPASVSVTNATPEQAAKAVKDAGGTGLRPGQWETRVELVEAAMAGLPPATAEAIKSHPERTKTHRYCLKPEEASNPGGGLFGGGEENDCKIDRLTMAGGRIDQQVSCPGPDGKTAMVMITSGTYTAESMTGTATMEMAPMKMKMKVNLSSRRVGECGAGAKAK